MKFKVKISALDFGKMVSFNHTFDTPEFEDKDESFLNHSWVNTVERQQADWLDENYQLVVDECEKRDLHPIMGFVPVHKKVKTDKKKAIVTALEELNLDIEHIALIRGTLNDLWPSIKNLSVEKIIEIVINSVNVTAKVSTTILKDLNGLFERKVIEITGNQSNQKLI